MEKPKIFVTRQIQKKGLDLLAKHFDVEISQYDGVLSKRQIIKNIRGKDGVLCLLTDHVDKEVIDSSPDIKIYSNYAVGYDNIDVKYATEKGIAVTNTPKVLTETVAEHAISLMFSLARRIVEADKYSRAGKYKGWEPELLLGRDIHSKTLGIIGAGSIGSEVAGRCRAMKMNVIYYSRHRNKELDKLGAKFVSFEEILRKSDIITLHVPLTPKTKHLIGRQQFKVMKNNAIIINTSRGPVIDEKELIEALKNNDIWGAAIDVFEFEPEISKGLLKLDNVILTPHIASASIETREAMSILAAKNLIAFFNNKKIPALVNPNYAKNKIKAIAFDLDGTLFLTEKQKKQFMGDLLAEKFNVPSSKVSKVYSKFSGQGYNRTEKINLLFKHFLERPANPKELKEIYNKFGKKYREFAETCPLVSCGPYLKDINAKVDKLFVVSLAAGEDIRAALKKCDLSKYFKEILGGEKTKEANLKFIMKKYKLSPGNILYIGNAKNDLETSTNLGMKFVGISHETSERKYLSKQGVKHVFVDLCGVVEIINKV